MKNVLGPDDHLNEKEEKRSRSPSGEVEVSNTVNVGPLPYGDDEDGRLPTEEERATLRLVAGCVIFLFAVRTPQKSKDGAICRVLEK